MNLTRFALDKRVVVLALVAVAVIAGLLTFMTMPRREDPQILIRTCVVKTAWPGASAEKIESLVTDPLETAIYQLDEVEEIRSESRTGQSLIFVDLDETINEIDQLWDDVRNKVSQASAQLPEGCGVPYVNSDFGDVYPIVMALYQSPPESGVVERTYSDRELEVLADRVRDELKTISDVGKVDYFGLQEEVIYLEPDAVEWSKIGLTSADLQALLSARNIVAPGGSISTDQSTFSVIPSGDFEGVQQIQDVLVGLQDGRIPVTLGDLPLDVRRTTVEPLLRRVRFNDGAVQAERALLLAVGMKSGRNVVALGAEIDRRIGVLREKVLPPDIQIVRINDLPRQVSTLVSDFVTNLWQAIVIVLLVALFMMGWRPAVIMATAIPLCMIAAILLVAQMGIELEQFSIASLIIALGMLVDNAIVVSENVLTEIKKGGDRIQACIRGAWDLALPLLTSTLTTVAAFLPMVTIVGNVGEYVRSLPIVVATTLLVSFVVAMTMTPIMCFWLLPASGGESTGKPAGKPSGGMYDRVVRFCMGHKLLTLGAAGAGVVASFMLVPMIGSQFFPGGVRDQFWVNVWMPEGSSFEATAARCREVERLILETRETEVDGDPVDRLLNLTTIVGSGGPRLNLTTNPEQEYPSYGLLLVNTVDPTLSRPWASELTALVREMPGVRVDVKPFNLGPAVPNPVEFRLVGDDAELLREKAEEMIAIMRDTPGARNPWSNWYNDAPRVDLVIEPEAANLAGVTNQDVAATLDTLLSGGYLTTYREGDHTVAVRLRAHADQPERLLGELEQMYVNGNQGKVPLGSVATAVPSWGPTVIARKNTQRTVTVGCQVAPGFLPNSVASALRPKLEGMMAALPASYRLEDGGETEKTTESSAKIINSFLISAALILLVLISQYNSFLKPFVVLATVPLALIGALLGLYATGWALGFMPALGIVSLAGVVINNAIILVEVIELNIQEGLDLEDAVARAGQARMKPILLTTLTTVAGMVPLALFGGPMWAGMSWAIIFGLVLSTGLTLLVIPTLYLFAVKVLGMRTS